MSRPSLREVMDLHWEGTGNDSRMWEHVDVLLSALNIEKSRAEQAEASLAAMTKDRDAWTESAAQFSRNADFYRGLVSGIGEQFGEAAHISDDGSRQQDVLCLKVPELVAAVRKELDAFKHALAVEIKGEHAEECDCLDHRRAAERLLSGFKSFDSYIDNLYVVGELKSSLAAERATVAELRKETERIENLRRQEWHGRNDESTRRLAAEAKVFELEAHYKRVMALPHPAEAKLKVEHDACSEAISQLEASEAKVAQEHENFLAVHRDNMALVLRVAALSKDLARAREALRVFKRYGRHRGSCVQMTGKTCSCGFDDAATKAGGIAAPEAPSESAATKKPCSTCAMPGVPHQPGCRYAPDSAAGGKEG